MHIYKVSKRVSQRHRRKNGVVIGLAAILVCVTPRHTRHSRRTSIISPVDTFPIRLLGSAATLYVDLSPQARTTTIYQLRSVTKLVCREIGLWRVSDLRSDDFRNRRTR